MNYEEAAAFWTERDKTAVKMPEAELRGAVESFIKARNTCALAVADGDFVRCTPLTYKYRAGKFIIFSEGGQKFRALKENKHAALAIFDDYKGPGSAKSLQITGTAAVYGADDTDYAEQLTPPRRKRRAYAAAPSHPHPYHATDTRIPRRHTKGAGLQPAPIAPNRTAQVEDTSTSEVM